MKVRKKVLQQRYMELAREKNITPLAVTAAHCASGITRMPVITSGYVELTYPNRIIFIAEPSASDLKNAPSTIEAHIRLPLGLGHGGPEGVRFSLGELFCGLGVVLFDSSPRCVCKVAHWLSVTHRIEATEWLCKGDHVIRVQFLYKNPNVLCGNGTSWLLIYGERIG